MSRLTVVCVVLLTVAPATVYADDHDFGHHSSSGSGCGSSSGGSSSSSSSPSSGSAGSSDPGVVDPTANAPHKSVFVTSTTHTGDIGGLAAADALCQEHASNALMTSTFKAWLSSGSENAFDRMTGNGPWYTTHSALAFKDKLALRQGTLADITDESGSKPSLDVWSGSDGLGDASGQDCKGWTSAAITDEATTGSTFTNDGRWGGGGSAQNCDVPRAIICFEQ